MKLNDAIYEVMTAEENYNWDHEDRLVMTAERHARIIKAKHDYIDELAACRYNVDRCMIQDHINNVFDEIYFDFG